MIHKVTTDDFSTIERLVRNGQAIDIGIDWLSSILTWSWIYYATFTFKP